MEEENEGRKRARGTQVETKPLEVPVKQKRGMHAEQNNIATFSRCFFFNCMPLLFGGHNTVNGKCMLCCAHSFWCCLMVIFRFSLLLGDLSRVISISLIHQCSVLHTVSRCLNLKCVRRS